LLDRVSRRLGTGSIRSGSIEHVGDGLPDRIRAVRGSIGEIEESSSEVQQLGSERVVIEIRYQWMHDCTADRSRKHRSRDTLIRPRVIAHDQPVLDAP
jgi:hypothetical protein